MTPQEVLYNRILKLSELRDNPKQFVALFAYYKNNPVDFISDWCITYDPRVNPSTLPFTLYPKQKDYINWLKHKWENRLDGLTEKSRDAGVTWLACAFSVWLFLFHDGQKIGWGSRKEALVDSLGDPDSIFEKMRMILSSLPKEFLPKGFNIGKDAPYMKIINHENGSMIRGEAGDNIGRGGRSSVYFKDEAQPMYSNILTPNGWKRMGDISIGDSVIGSNGKETKVIGINDCGVYPVYRIGFSDGSTADCSEGHKWSVNKVSGKRESLVLSTKEILESFIYHSPKGQTQYKYRVPVTIPVCFSQQKPPLHPYIVGALIGDGTLTDGTVRLTSADVELAAEVESLLPDGLYLTKGGKYEYRIVNSLSNRSRWKANKIRNILDDIDLSGKTADQKFIPDIYKYSAVDERIALIQGLMDTDGSASGGVASFHTCSERLAKDVIFVVQSLGGTATHNIKPDHRGYRDMHVLHLAVDFMPFRLQRKIEKLGKRKHPKGRTITSVEYIAHHKVRCITVDAADGLYLTDNCIVTHNSAFYERPERIEAALSANSDVKIDISTPNGNGNPFYRKRFGGEIPVFTFHWRDDPRKDENWYQEQKRRLDPVIVAQEIDISYDASVDNVLVNGERVDVAMRTRMTDIEQSPDAPIVLGVDVARFGSDRTVIAIRQGRILSGISIYEKLDTMQVVAAVMNICNTMAVSAVFIDETGVGAGVVDRLTEVCHSYVCGVNFGGKPDSQHYMNKRAEMWGELNEWLKGTVSLPNSPEVKTDLCGLRYKFNSNGQLVLESKEDAKKRGVKSPDIGDAIALTFAETVTPTVYMPSNHNRISGY